MNLDNNNVFAAAQDAFRATLPSKDKAQFTTCASPADLLSSLQQLKALTGQGQKRKLNRCLDVVRQLNNRLQTYFDALNVIVSVDDTAALAYGAVRVVLQLASALPSFFDKLLAAIGRLTDTFPQYEAIVDIFDGQPSPRMRQHLEKVYQDFFEFLRLAARVFTASSGRIKRPAEMITNVIWKPFDATFSDILIQMDYHRGFILEELEILQARRAKDADRAASLERVYAEKERLRAEESRNRTKNLEDLAKGTREAYTREIKESSIRRIMDWLAPPPFAEMLETSQEHRIDGTAQWIFRETAFTDWFSTEIDVKQQTKWETMPPWVLWVCGNPGCGKTTLASSVYDELVEEIKSQNLHHMTCYFFFKYTSQTSSTIEAAYRSALAQILHRNRDNTIFLDKFLFMQTDSASSSGQPSATAKELSDLMCICADTLGHVIFIVDGIDEADNPNEVSEKLKQLVIEAPVKLICFSRPNVNHLQSIVPTRQRIAFNRHVTNPDIRVFLEWELQKMLEENKIPTSADINSLVRTLLGGADGMFLWAKLMIRYLRSPALKPSTRLRVMNSVRFPEGLNAMYNRIIALIIASDKPEVELARRILLWMQHSKTSAVGLSLNWLRTAVSDHIDPDEYDDFSSVAVAACGGLIEFSDRDGFKFIHLTVGEYLEDISTSGESAKKALIPQKNVAVLEIVSICIEYLLSHAPLQMPLARLSRSIYASAEAKLEFQYSFEAYATGYLVSHLVDISLDELFVEGYNDGETDAVIYHSIRLRTLIARFLDSPLALGFWTENIYITQRRVKPIVDQITHWTKQTSNNSANNLMRRLSNLAKDLQSIENEWGSKLIAEPHLLWNDVMIFTKFETFSKLDMSNIGAVTTLAPKIVDTNGPDIPLCLISSTSSDTLVTGVLSITPSTDFVQFWRSTTRSGAYELGERFCDGWVAQYELWSSVSKARLASINIQLPQSEISTLFRQSFRQKGHEFQLESVNFETSFPLAIGSGCLTFAVLRTIYKIQPDESKPLAKYQSCLLPLEFLSHFTSKWGEDLQMFHPDDHGALPQMFHLAWRDWYTYSISFSPDGKFVSFADYQQPCLVSLAVFEIQQSPDFGLKCIQTTEARLGLPRVKEMIFHSQAPLLVFLAEVKVWLWPFSGEKASKPIHLKTAFDKCRDGSRLDYFQGICLWHKRPIKDCILSSLSFSVCGNFVLARNAKDTEVLQIPQEMLSPSVLGHELKSKRQSDPDDVESNDFSTYISRLGGGQCLPGETLSGTNLVSAGDIPTIMTLTSIDNSIDLEIFSQYAANSKTRIQLLALPNSLNTKNTAISVKVPAMPDEHLRITLNKKSVEEYTLDADRDFAHPTIIEKNMKSVVAISDATSIAPEALGPPPKRLKGSGLVIQEDCSSK